MKKMFIKYVIVSHRGKFFRVGKIKGKYHTPYSWIENYKKASQFDSKETARKTAKDERLMNYKIKPYHRFIKGGEKR